MYKICWVSLETGLEGSGEFIFSTYQAAKACADWANRECPELDHWVIGEGESTPRVSSQEQIGETQ